MYLNKIILANGWNSLWYPRYLSTWPDWGKKYWKCLSQCQILKLHLWEVHLSVVVFYFDSKDKKSCIVYSVGLLICRTNVTKTSTGGSPHSHKPLAQRVLIVAAETWFLLTGRFVCVCVCSCTAVFITRTYSWAHYNNIRYYHRAAPSGGPTSLRRSKSRSSFILLNIIIIITIIYFIFQGHRPPVLAAVVCGRWQAGEMRTRVVNRRWWSKMKIEKRRRWRRTMCSCTRRHRTRYDGFRTPARHQRAYNACTRAHTKETR